MKYLRDLWDESVASALPDELERLRYRSNLLGADLRMIDANVPFFPFTLLAAQVWRLPVPDGPVCVGKRLIQEDHSQVAEKTRDQVIVGGRVTQVGREFAGDDGGGNRVLPETAQALVGSVAELHCRQRQAQHQRSQRLEPENGHGPINRRYRLARRVENGINGFEEFTAQGRIEGSILPMSLTLQSGSLTFSTICSARMGGEGKSGLPRIRASNASVSPGLAEFGGTSKSVAVTHSSSPKVGNVLLWFLLNHCTESPAGQIGPGRAAWPYTFASSAAAAAAVSRSAGSLA